MSDSLLLPPHEWPFPFHLGLLHWVGFGEERKRKMMQTVFFKTGGSISTLTIQNKVDMDPRKAVKKGFFFHGKIDLV